MYKINWGKVSLVILVLALGAFLRFFKLSEYPVQLNHDEVSQLYDTYSILKTGKDIYGNFLPLAFPSTGDYKVGHYIYISTIPVFLIGDKEFTIRIVSAFFGTLTVLAVFLFVNVLTKKWIVSILAALLIAITPSEIFYSRKSFENVIGVCLEFFGLFFLLNNLIVGKNKIWAYIGILLMSLAMYIYTSHMITVPLILAFMAFSFRERVFAQKKYFLSLFLIWIVFIIPLIYLAFKNEDLRFRAASVFINQDVNFGKIVELTHNTPKSYIDIISLKFLNQFNPTYLFVNGLDLTNQGGLGVGPLLLIQFPLVILGTIFLLRNKIYKLARSFLFVVLIIVFIPSALTFEDYSPHRAMLAFATLSIISAFGLYWLSLQIKKRISSSRVRAFFFSLISFCLILNFLYFWRIYTESYPFEKSEKIQYPFKEVSLYIWSQYNNFDQIVFDPKFGETTPMIGVGSQYYLAYYGNYPPQKLQMELKVGKKPRELIFDKFSIREVYWPEDNKLKNSLIIVSPWSLPPKDVKEDLIIKRFNFYDGILAFYAIRL